MCVQIDTTQSVENSYILRPRSRQGQVLIFALFKVDLIILENRLTKKV